MFDTSRGNAAWLAISPRATRAGCGWTDGQDIRPNSVDATENVAVMATIGRITGRATTAMMGGRSADRPDGAFLSTQVHLQDALMQLRSIASPMRESMAPELDAAITHWLADPTAVPPMASREDVESWLRTVDPSTIDWSAIPLRPSNKPTFTFIDLFAGIGGFRVAMQNLGGRCVFSSEWNASARETYYMNFGEIPYGDIGQFAASSPSGSESASDIPDHDVLCAGFPCQPFSLAGVSARNALGRNHGFACETQGTAFFHIAQIVRAKQPRVVILENVRNLVSHDAGRTLAVIERVFRNQPDDREPGLGYSLADPFLLDSSTLVAQKRVRLFMVAFRSADDAAAFRIPDLSGPEIPLRTVITEDAPPEFTISDRLWKGHVARSARNREAGKGFVTGEADLDRPSHTLVARYGKDGKECLVPQGEHRNPRMLTPAECRKLMGFPDEYELPESRAAAYRQFGNAVVVPVIEAVGRAALPVTMIVGNQHAIRARVMTWGRGHYQSFGWRKTDNPWHALLAEVLLARTRAGTVAGVWQSMIARWPTASDLANASLDEVAAEVESLGLRGRAGRLQELASRAALGIPSSREGLLELPGVGEYTAAAFRSLHLNERDVLVDANVARWLCRLNGWPYCAESRRDRRVIQAAESLTPPRAHRRYNYATLDFTMQACTSARPSCRECPLLDVCRFGTDHAPPGELRLDTGGDLL